MRDDAEAILCELLVLRCRRGVLFVLPAAVVLLRTAVEQSELRTHERILAIAYRLARLSEGPAAR